MKRRVPYKLSVAAAAALVWTAFLAPTARGQTNLPVSAEIAAGPFQPTWESLASQYHCPDWFRDAKFGIWAHWGPQCQPEHGDWYARSMYQQGSPEYKFHVEHYGHPSKFGFKDVIREWKAEKWDPEKLIGLYKQAGAKYFMALANHHDNFDNWDSKYQPWNSVEYRSKKDIVGDWAKAARAHGLRFGVSVHAAHAWTWYEPAQGPTRPDRWPAFPTTASSRRRTARACGGTATTRRTSTRKTTTGRQQDWQWWEWNAAKEQHPDAAYVESSSTAPRISSTSTGRT